MTPIRFIDRASGQECTEEVYGGRALQLLYGDNPLTRWITPAFLYALTKRPWFSRLYGWIQKQSWTRRKIQPFIENFKVNTSEFLDPAETFTSFNDFFIRKLQPSARPFPSDPKCAILPADGRYLVVPDIGMTQPFEVKDQVVTLETFLGSAQLATQFAGGSLVLARLCPSDYHRYHFPVSGRASPPISINGALQSVNPWALAKHPFILQENRRIITIIDSEEFGPVAMVEIGATCVGTIVHTFTPNQNYLIGDEKGFFSFGGSAIALLFGPGAIQLDQDLVDNSERGMETRCLFGQRLGISK